MPFKMVKVEWSEGFETVSTLVPLRIESGTTIESKSKMPSREKCEIILNAIREAWYKNQPWSVFPQSKRTGQYAPLNISREFDVPFKTAEFILEEWQRNGVIEMSDATGNKTGRGLQVKGSLG